MFVVVITLLNLSGARRQGGHPDCQVFGELHLAIIRTVKFNNLFSKVKFTLEQAMEAQRGSRV
jgi:hypothetical protein